MPEYAPGTPSWVELGSPDPDASVRFYGELFGWDATEPGPVEETGGYRTFTQDGKSVAGLMGLMQENQPPFWSTYVSVADADETVERARANGGTIHVEPMDVLDIGRMAFFADPTGGFIGVWQSKTFAGADLVNVPNSLCWNELYTRDPEGAKAFYGEVFGWEPGSPPFEGAGDYVVWNVDGNGVGGMMPMGDMFTAEVPPHWAVTFAVADTDATVAKALELGGSATSPPTDIPIGRYAGLRDTHGVPFNIIAM
jgi:uncharacterized protein